MGQLAARGVRKLGLEPTVSIRNRRRLAATLLAAVMTPSAQAADKVVNLYNWAGYFEPSVINDFTRETGIKVVYDVFDSEEMLETKLLTGRSGYDVVVPSTNFLARQIEAGVFQKLDKSKLPNISNMWDLIQRQTARYDPGNSYSVNYMSALHGSSHYELPFVLRWFTGNIGIHHVHHLSSKIPFYRLPQILHDHPELRATGRVTLLQSLSCIRLALWDERDKRLVSFRIARRAR